MSKNKERKKRAQMKGKGKMGGVYQPSYTNKKTGEKVTVPTWWIYYNCKGKQIKESSRCMKEQDAWKLLKKRHGEIEAGKPVGLDVTRTTFEAMAELIERRLQSQRAQVGAEVQDYDRSPGGGLRR